VSNEKAGVTCGKCGHKNPLGANYCLSCGKKLGEPVESGLRSFEGLSLLHLTGSAYVLISVLFSELIRQTVFLVPYLATGLLGLAAAYEFHNWPNVERERLVTAVSLLTIALGFGATFVLFLLGLTVHGVIGPAWAIFLINGWKLWTDRHRLRTKTARALKNTS
jgi:hypothetical protein